MAAEAMQPDKLLANPALAGRLREELASTGRKPAFFPTAQVREVCYRLLSEEVLPHERRQDLYIAAAISMLELLLEREDLRDRQYRPLALIRAVADTVSRLAEQPRAILLLHLFCGKEPHEIREITGLESVVDLLSQARAALAERLSDSKLHLDDLAKAGIGPVGDLTKVLEEVRQGKLGVDQMFVAGYRHMQEAAAPQLRRETIPGLEQPEDLIAEMFTRLKLDPESVPRNRMELRGFVATIAKNVMIDKVERRGVMRGKGATHVELDERLHSLSDEERERRLLLETLDEALLILRKKEKVAPVHATLSVQDRMFDALLKLRCQPNGERKCNVLLLRHQDGKTIEETSSALGMSPATVKRDAQESIAFIRQELGLAESATGGL